MTECERTDADAVALQLASDYTAQTATNLNVFVCEIADGARADYLS